MPMCSAYNCSYRHTKSAGRTVHRFPFSRPNILKEWIFNLKRANWQPKHSSVICSDHFEPECFDRRGKLVKLRPNAAPTRFNFPPYLIKEGLRGNRKKLENETQTNPLAKIFSAELPAENGSRNSSIKNGHAVTLAEKTLIINGSELSVVFADDSPAKDITEELPLINKVLSVMPSAEDRASNLPVIKKVFTVKSSSGVKAGNLPVIEKFYSVKPLAKNRTTGNSSLINLVSSIWSTANNRTGDSSCDEISSKDKEESMLTSYVRAIGLDHSYSGGPLPPELIRKLTKQKAKILKYKKVMKVKQQSLRRLKKRFQSLNNMLLNKSDSIKRSCSS